MTPKRFLKLALIGKYKTALEGADVAYTVKRSFLARNVRLEIRSASGLTVVIPKRYDIGELPALLRKKSRWILRKLAEQNKVPPPVEKKKLVSGDVIPYLGRHLTVVLQDGSGEPPKLDGNRLLLNLSSGNGHLTLAVESWYLQQARNFIRKRTDELCPLLGVSYGRLNVRKARTRWGSCSYKGNLNFNWKLIMAPESIVDYVIIHELTHLKEMNHSKKFWNLVASHCPEWRDCRRWLKQHETELASM